MISSVQAETSTVDKTGYGRISFVVIGQGPHKPEEELQLERALRRDPAIRSADFLIHLGGMMAHATERPEAAYSRIAGWLRSHSIPALLLPGRTEWREDSSGAREAWRSRFLEAESAHDDPEPEEDTGLSAAEIQRQPEHPENFAFARAQVLFLGIDLPGGGEATEEEAIQAQTLHAIHWVQTHLSPGPNRYRGAVVFAHAFPGHRHREFAEAFQQAAREFGQPILYLHTDSVYFPEDQPHREGPPHTRGLLTPASYHRDFPWPELNVLRVRTEPLGAAPPLKVSVMGDAAPDGDLFVFDRRYFRGPYLTCSTHNSINLAWRTEGPISPEVWIGREPGGSESILEAPAIRCRTADAEKNEFRLHSAPEGACQYDVTLTNLESATKYYYQIRDGTRVLAGGGEKHYFYTHPEPGSRGPLRVWAFGDSGRGNQPQADVHRSMRRFCSGEERPVDLFLHCGDMAYTRGTDDEFQRNFFRPYESTLRHIPLWPTMSNHEGHTSSGQTDTGPYYDAFVLPTRGEAGGVPSHTQSFFGFDYGNVHFICLCSYSIDLSPEGAQSTWLRKNLAEVRKRGWTDWVVAYFHHPPYTKGSHDSDRESGLIQVREYVMPILEEGGVDLILSGHSHTYERSMLINGAYGTPTVPADHVLDDGDGDPDGDGPYRKSPGIQPHQGCVTVVCGCGGTAMSRRGTSPLMKKIIVENGSLLIDVEGSELTVRMLTSQGAIADRFTLSKDQPVDLKPVVQPWQAAPYVSYPRLPVRFSLRELPAKGRAAMALLHIPPLSYQAEASLEWNRDGTHWASNDFGSPLRLKVEQPFEKEVALVCEGEPFPLPDVQLVFQDPQQGRVVKPVHLDLPAWKTMDLPGLREEPVIDGMLDEALLQATPEQGQFVDYRGTGYDEVATRFQAGLWNGKLYVAVRCPEPEMDRLHVNDPEAPEAHGTDDAVEVFLHRVEEGNIYHFAVNSAGQRMDARNGVGPEHRTWSGNWQSAVRRESSEWTAEFLIDLGMLGDPLRPGQELRLNVGRNHSVRRQYTQWSYTNRTPHVPTYYGVARVVGGEEG